MVFRFGVFEFDPDSGELRKNGRAAPLEPQPARALALLLSRSGDVVGREEIRDAVWGSDTHVDFDRGLAYCLSQVRSALGDSADNPRFIQTVPRRGFKFIAPVSRDLPGASHAREVRVAAPAAGGGPPLWAVGLALAVFGALATLLFWFLVRDSAPSNDRVVIAVSVFDNETGNPDYDRPVAGLSDLVVAHLTTIDPARVAVVGNAAILRQPRNIRNLKAVGESVRADYVLLGQLQSGETGLRFITHFIRLQDEAHLKANRLTVEDATLAGLEAAVVEEFDRAVRLHILGRAGN
jgi:DNA-binding winged helix-turn-helix (wHTH) protein/TolB-like protein